MSVWHVYPDNDLREHETDGKLCWCRPEFEYEDDNEFIIHNSMDGRELIETGERMMN